MLSVQALSEAALSRQSGSHPAVGGSLLTTVSIKLRVQAQDPQRSLSDLLTIQAPHYSAEQAQNALFYHMTEAGYLQLGGQVVRPQAAYVEMTTRRDQSLDIVFVFALPRKVLTSEATVHFVVDKAFFLSQPVEFTLPSTQLLAAS